MSLIKNEHIVWAYADREDGNGQVVFLGLTDHGIAYLKAGKGFVNVTQIVVFHEKDKATLKERFRQAGVAISEVN